MRRSENQQTQPATTRRENKKNQYSRSNKKKP